MQQRPEDMVMSQVWGFGVTAISVLVAAVTSGLRLKPYLDAGVARTPPTFALYPILIAAAIAVPLVFLLRWWQRQQDVDIGPIRLSGNLPFIAFGCTLYVIVAVGWFPYQPPPKPQKTIPTTDPQTIPLSTSNFSVF
jgi:hypothetical protein